MQSYIDALYEAATKVETDPSDQINTLVVKHIRDEAIKLEQLQEHNMYIRTPSAVIAPDLTVITSPPTTLATESIYEYDFPTADIDPMTASDWQNTILTPLYNSFTGDVNLLSVENGKLRAEHPVGSNADLNSNFVISPNTRQVYWAESTAELSPNWAVTNATDGGKLGWGLTGGSYPYTLSNGTVINRTMGGGTTETTGHSFRWGFRGNEWTIYAYYVNRPGMNYPGTPPSGPVYGEDIFSGVSMVAGQEYKLAMELTLNTSGNADGILRGFIDDNEVITKTGIYFMDGTPEVNRGVISSNNGGAGVAADNIYVDYDNIKYFASPT